MTGDELERLDDLHGDRGWLAHVPADGHDIDPAREVSAHSLISARHLGQRRFAEPASALQPGGDPHRSARLRTHSRDDLFEFVGADHRPLERLPGRWRRRISHRCRHLNAQVLDVTGDGDPAVDRDRVSCRGYVH